MEMEKEKIKTGLVLPGGGARGAYQIGVLKAIAQLLPEKRKNPFSVISGTSAGAVNAVVLAAEAERFSHAVDQLIKVWGSIKSHQVYKSDNWTMLKSTMHWFTAIVFGGYPFGLPRSLLDNSPLRKLLADNIQCEQVQSSIDKGFIDAVSVVAAGYSSSRSTSFFQANQRTEEWSRTRREGVRCSLNLDHLMASLALPLIFPPVLIDGLYYGDGAMRQATPLSSAIHLGANRILVIGVNNEGSKNNEHLVQEKSQILSPTFPQIAGYMLDTLFMDGLYSDLEQIMRTNFLLDKLSSENKSMYGKDIYPIDTMVVAPSKNLRDLAHECRHTLPLPIRALFRGVGGKNHRGTDQLISFLLFEQLYTNSLIDLGFKDAMAVKNNLLDFILGNDVPRLFIPNWLNITITNEK